MRFVSLLQQSYLAGTTLDDGEMRAVAVKLLLPVAASTLVRVVALGVAVLLGALLSLFPQRGAPASPRNLLTVSFVIG